LPYQYLYLRINYCCFAGKVSIPRQLVITKEKDPSSIPYEVTKAGMKLPLGMYLWDASNLLF